MHKTPAEIEANRVGRNQEVIARKNTATPNFTAQGATSQTGALESDIELPAGFQKDATGQIFATGDSGTSPVITSEDSRSEFDKNKSFLDEKLEAVSATETPEIEAPTETAPAESGVKFDEETGRVTSGKDPIMDSLNAWEKERATVFEEEAQQRQEQYDSLFSSSLASINTTMASTIQNIKQSYTKRLGEQRRINNLNIARVKAYGLGKGGQYTPINFSDAVSAREEEASERISVLEGERNSLLARAEASARSGRNDLLRANMKDIERIEKDLNDNLARVQKEADKQYAVLTSFRKQAEQEHQDKLEETRRQFALIASSYLEEYEGKTRAEKDAFIFELQTSTGLDYATIFSELEGSSSEAQKLRKTSEKEARGDLRTIKGKLYQITYDKDGKAQRTLVGGDGGGGGGGGNEDEPEEEGEVASYDEFLKQWGEANKQSSDPESPEIKKLYNEYVTSVVSKETITKTDKKKMIARGLNPENDEDIQTYIKAEYDPLK